MAFPNLDELVKQRKWFQAAEEIKRIIRDGQLSSDDNSYLLRMTQELIPRMHPISMCSLVIKLAEIQEENTALGLLSTALATIISVSHREDKYPNEKLGIRMNMAISKIKMGNYEGCESEIFEWLEMCKSDRKRRWEFSMECKETLYKVAYLYYRATGNVEKEQEYLLEYSKISQDDNEINRLIDVSLVSMSFFDFASVISLDGFENIKDESKRQLFLDFQNGSFEKIKKWEKQLKNTIIGVVGEKRFDEYMNGVTEKIYLINIISLCFRTTDKFIALETLCHALQVNDEMIVRLVLRLLGYGLVEGWIDTERGLLMFNKVVPKSLSMSEITEMKERYIRWRDRVQRAINQIVQ